MVCEKCERKLRSVAAPERWREGSRNVTGRGRQVGGNKLVCFGFSISLFFFWQMGRSFQPFQGHCLICKGQVLQQGYKVCFVLLLLILPQYCGTCAYKNGVCAMCGERVLDVRPYKQILR